MKHKYIIEKAAWLENRKESWSNPFNEVIISFHDRIEDLIEELKENFNDKDDPIAIHKEYIDYMNDAFDDLRESVKQVKEEEVLVKLWDELSLNFVFWKEEFKKMSESLDNRNSIFKLGYEVFNLITIYNTKKTRKKYYDLLTGELDDKRENVSNFIKEIRIEINNRLVDLNASDIFSMTNLDDKEVKDYTLNQGDEVRYYMTNDDENNALISHNQEELKEENNIRLISKQDGTSFEIDKSKLIEILPKHKTLNQEVADKLKKIKTDPDKLEELSDYLDKLKVTESVDITDNNYNEIILNIFPAAIDIEYNKKFNRILFNVNNQEKKVNIHNYKGIFNEGDFYRIVGSDISKNWDMDYIFFSNGYELYVFMYDKSLIEILSNSDLIIDGTLFINNYKNL